MSGTSQAMHACKQPTGMQPTRTVCQLCQPVGLKAHSKVKYGMYVPPVLPSTIADTYRIGNLQPLTCSETWLLASCAALSYLRQVVQHGPVISPSSLLLIQPPPNIVLPPVQPHHHQPARRPPEQPMEPALLGVRVCARVSPLGAWFVSGFGWLVARRGARAERRTPSSGSCRRRGVG